MDFVPRTNVQLGALCKVLYLETETMKDFDDVQLISKSGEKFALNRCILAAQSNFCHDVLKDLYLCPIANSEEEISIITNFSSEELQVMKNFFLSGQLPTLPLLGSVDLSANSVFRAFGLDLITFQSSTIEDTQPYNIKCIKEEVDPAYQLAEGEGDETVLCPPAAESSDEESLALKRTNKRKAKSPNSKLSLQVKKPKTKKLSQTNGVQASSRKRSCKEKENPLLYTNKKESYFYFPSNAASL